MKIGIMGGTFDPVHNGHLMLAEEAYKQFQLDEVWFMPNGNPPHKSAHAPEASAKQRAEMVKKAITGTEYFRLEDYEVQSGEISYSYKTMEHLRKKYPDHDFYFIIGADSLFTLCHWMKPERLMAACTILAACRGEIDTRDKMNRQIADLTRRYGAKIEILPAPLMAVSSQEIRASLMDDDEKLQTCIPSETYKYIKDKQLYKGC